LTVVGCSGSNSGSGSSGGGSPPNGGSPNTGGSQSTSAVGGNPAGGNNTQASTGGAGQGGGGTATGGSNPNTGGANAGGTTGNNTGGANAGGTSNVGGNNTATGGKATGGATGAGGTSAAGGTGTKAAGGTATTGGSAATGGSSSQPTTVCKTSANNNLWKDATVSTGSGTADVTVGTTEGQTWEGFGGAFNEKGWIALASGARTQAMTLLFSSTDGANFTWGRIPIGASDYASSRYTLDDTPSTGSDPTPNGETARPAADTALANFKIANGHETRT